MENGINSIEANNKCRDFFNKVAEELKDKYEVVGSCNKDSSAYLIPKGTEKELSYYSKPAFSFRVSDHWNWFSNIKKCKIVDYVQCESVDMPIPRDRPREGKASLPRRGSQVCLMYPDGKYHCVFGYSYNRTSGKWKWIEKEPKHAIELAWNFRSSYSK